MQLLDQHFILVCVNKQATEIWLGYDTNDVLEFCGTRGATG